MAETTAVPRIPIDARPANKKWKFIVGGLVIVAVIAYLIVSSVGSAGAYYKEVHEVTSQQAALTGTKLRVSGLVDTQSIRWDAQDFDLSFMISDQNNPGEKLRIHFHGVQPDNMNREGSIAIVEGRLGADGVLEADTLLLKCPSRYEEAPQEVKSMG
ncbi:MAG: cytochrome c maturation protein CcmE [Anaerolineae bacterium]|nr:MAG: cytochrome c maturation protein CcmE [Anaerolineae bacterium]